jgi:hypothetical protein
MSFRAMTEAMLIQSGPQLADAFLQKHRATRPPSALSDDRGARRLAGGPGEAMRPGSAAEMVILHRRLEISGDLVGQSIPAITTLRSWRR